MMHKVLVRMRFVVKIGSGTVGVSGASGPFAGVVEYAEE